MLLCTNLGRRRCVRLRSRLRFRWHLRIGRGCVLRLGLGCGLGCGCGRRGRRRGQGRSRRRPCRSGVALAGSTGRTDVQHGQAGGQMSAEVATVDHLDRVGLARSIGAQAKPAEERRCSDREQVQQSREEHHRRQPAIEAPLAQNARSRAVHPMRFPRTHPRPGRARSVRRPRRRSPVTTRRGPASPCRRDGCPPP